MFEFSTLDIYPISGWQLILTCLIKAGQKFVHFYGQPEARLNRDDSVYGHPTNRRTWFIKIISIFLFSAPDIHLENLQKMWVDGLLHKAVWEEGLKKVIQEWQEFILNVSNKTQTTTCLMSYFLEGFFFFECKSPRLF